MSEDTITRLTPQALDRTAPRECGVARVIALPARPTGRLIEPLGVRPSRPAGDDLGPLARALRAMAAAEAD